MTLGFTVDTATRFNRTFRALRKKHPELARLGEQAETILSDDPYNRSGKHSIKKLTEIKKGEGQYRLRLKRFRFRYDIDGKRVTLVYCGLRREDTYK